MKIGGDPENYMEAPVLNIGGGGDGGGGPSFIASILDLLGIHRQVAKPEKESKKATGSDPSVTSNTASLPGTNPAGKHTNLSTPSLPILDNVAAALPMAPSMSTPKGISETTWLGGYRANVPSTMQFIDPNLGF